MSDAVGSTDRWSDWLKEGRFQGHASVACHAAVDLLHQIRDRVLQNADLRPGLVVLDAGAGTGLLAAEASRLIGPSGKVVALDVSVSSLRDTETADSIVRVAGDVKHLPFADGTFDRVVMRSVLLYVSTKCRALEEISRVLADKGTLSIFEPLNSGRSHNVDLSSFNDHWDATPIARSSAGYANDDDVMPYVERAGLTPNVLVRELIVDSFATIEEVDGYLARRPNPLADPPIVEVTNRFGLTAAAEYRSAWHAHLRAGPVGFSTPIMYLSAVKSRGDPSE